METALDILHKQDCKGYCEGPVYGDSYYENEEIVQAMILFAQMHVKAALKEVQTNMNKAFIPDGFGSFHLEFSNLKHILDSYSLENIK